MKPEQEISSFEQLGLKPALCQVIKELGYEVPTPIQARSIPIILAGKDLVGQAQTGTGKTAAFALPLIHHLKTGASGPQILVLTPTRELAIQVAEAFASYGRNHKGFHVLPIYGGQSIVPQLRQLERRPQVIVGTPGRIMDHLRRKSLSLASITTVVADEADEMLSMGFLEDIQWIIEHAPKEKQTILFSATMPKPIRMVAERYLRNPEEVLIARASSEVVLIDQSHWMVSGLHKLDALTRVLELSDFNGMLVFVRTKTATVELAEKLEARGYSAAALSGDLSQEARERTVHKLKKGSLDILVATDVAARGLDLDRISHVVNYDIPFDAESYIHRIGRTGRAGRTGTAILFVSPRERGLLRSIERGINRTLPPFRMPTKEDLETKREERFVAKIEAALTQDNLQKFDGLLETVSRKTKATPSQIAAALCALIRQDEAPQFEQPRLDEFDGGQGRERSDGRRPERGAPRGRAQRNEGSRWGRKGPKDRSPRRSGSHGR